jgi:hypothetical protein
MGSSSGQSSSRGGVAPPQAPAPAPRKVYKPPVDANGQTVITENLKGAPGGTWTKDQINAGGRWEVPAGAPAGAIGRNFVPYVPPPEPRQQLAQLMTGGRPLPGRLQNEPGRITHGSSSSWRGGGDRGGSHAGFSGTQGAGGFSGWGGGGRGNVGGGLY